MRLQMMGNFPLERMKAKNEKFQKESVSNGNFISSKYFPQDWRYNKDIFR